MTTDCIDLKVDTETKRLAMTKPVYGGNALVELVSESSPQIATVRPKAMAAGTPQGGTSPSVVSLSIDMPAAQVVLKDRVQEEVVGVKLEDAAVVVSGGRGVGGPDPFNTVLKELADDSTGAVGASRPACDDGWRPRRCTSASPARLLPGTVCRRRNIGASQLMAAARLKDIVAINKDAEANIFREATYWWSRFEVVVPPSPQSCATDVGLTVSYRTKRKAHGWKPCSFLSSQRRGDTRTSGLLAIIFG